jgi:hypothetical protein
VCIDLDTRYRVRVRFVQEMDFRKLITVTEVVSWLVEIS